MPTPAPLPLLSQLRHAHAGEGLPLDQVLADHRLRPLGGARNNLVYTWDAAPNGQRTVIKLYAGDERRRSEREWHSLTLLREAGIDEAPAPLWRDTSPDYDAIGMTYLPGTPVPDLPGDMVAPALKALAELHSRLQQLPLQGLHRALPRIDHWQHYITRLTDVWPAQLAEAAHDPHTPDMLALLQAWEEHGGRTIPAGAGEPVFSRGDSNLLNWLWNEGGIGCVDLEFSGYSSVAFDAADLIEHISARDIPDPVWETLLPDLGVTGKVIPIFLAAQRTCALRWLAVLWKQRASRRAEFDRQHRRAACLLGAGRS
uniref:aminoglycoside phosphotransferase family protein n=1 Tax=Nonomuraea sp. CA-252377 TaxID=3240003 RepID=UPI003F498D7E